ncbi:MAG: AAA family ATPase [Nannocystaceae bacterium]
MKLLQLDVEGFKCVQRARVRFGPGLNVMYGPNDIGKSSLAEALRAVLLLPSPSSERRSFEPFGGGEPPHVRLLFTFRERFWRVDKRWGDGARGNAMLEVSGDGEVWSKHESQRAVDAELRKMLAWGVREPGGKGAPKGLPSSFITTALLGGAAPVDELFAADLGKDSDPAGRERLTEALQSFAEDPLFKRMLGQAQGMVDRAKDSRGNWRRGRDAPLFHIGERIRELQQELASLVRAAEHAEAVEQAAASHRERRAALLLEHEAQRASVERLRARCEAGAHAREVLAAREQAHAQLEACEQLHARAQALREQVAAAANDANTCATQVQQAEAEVERTRAAQQSAASALQRRGDREAAAHERTAALELRVAAASTACERIEAQRARVVEARTLADESARDGAEAADARAHARAAEQRASQAEAALRPAHEAVIACESALARARWREAQAEAERLHAAAREAASLQQQAQQRRLAHDARVRELDAAALPDDAALARVRELETRLRRARDQAAVGFAVTLQLAAPAGLSLDDAPARATASGSHAAQRRMQIDLGAAGSLAIEAGSAALREEVAAAEAAWARDGAPVLQRLALADVDALADRIAQAKQTRIELLAEAHACDALVREAQRLQPPPELLAQAQARVQALAAVVPADEDLAATAGIEVLERQREVLERDARRCASSCNRPSPRARWRRPTPSTRAPAPTASRRGPSTRASSSRPPARARGSGLVLAEIDDELAAARVELESVQRERAAALVNTSASTHRCSRPPMRPRSRWPTRSRARAPRG